MDTIYVIIPIYNGEKYIKRCLTSIFQQTYKNLKVIVINDGSKDGTLNELDAFNDKRLIILNQENSGVSAARNRGLDYALKYVNNDYIAFVDIDDYIDNDFFDTLLKHVSINNVDIVCSSYLYQKEKTSKPYIQIKNDQKLSCFDATNLLVADKTVQSHSHCKLYKDFVWKNVRFPAGVAWMEDQATIFKTFVNAKNGVYISNYPGYHYWQEGESACRSKMSNKRIIDSINGYKSVYDYSFESFSETERDKIKLSALDAFADTYLMMIPRVQSKLLTNQEKQYLKSIKSFIKKEKIIQKFHPDKKKNKYKKIAYLYLKPFYKILYKLFS